MDISLILDNLVPNAQYFGSLTENTQEAYNNLIWNDSRIKPTWQQLVNIWPSVNLQNYKKMKFNELNGKISIKIMYIKKLKKLDDIKSLFIDEYKKTHASLAEVDASIALIETDLFEV